MKRFPNLRFGVIAIFILSLVSVVAIACGSNESADSSTQNLSPFLGGGDSSKLLQATVNASGPEGPPGPASGSLASQPAAAVPTAAPFATIVPSLPQRSTDALEQRNLSGQDGGSFFDSGNPAPPQSPLDQQPVQFGNDRVIVRNVDMSIEVNNPAGTIEEISRIATAEGGWVVRTQNIEVHRGAIDIRVPADRLDIVLTALRTLASDVVSEVSTSQDFTEEFTDTSARVRTLQDTVDALRALFNRAEKIEDALTIQKEITRIQSDIESMQARINFLSQSAAFSLIRMSILALPQSVDLDAGPDKLAAVHRSVRFRAEFTPPEGIDNFRIEWDFGDGTGRQFVTGVAPVDTEGRVISAPVVHTYSDDTDSPYIVKVKMTGTGKSGAAEGEDVMVVTVNQVPPIEVFAGDNRVVDAGQEVTLRGSFTRPDGVSALTYTWNFGDGTAPVTVDAEPGATVAEITHTYANSRPQSYNVTLTVRGETDSGSTEGSDSIQIQARQPVSLTAGGFALGDSSRSAFRTLSSIGAGVGTAAIWIGVLSPIWLLAGVGLYILYRNRNRNQTRRTSKTLSNAAREATPND